MSIPNEGMGTLLKLLGICIIENCSQYIEKEASIAIIVVLIRVSRIFIHKLCSEQIDTNTYNSIIGTSFVMDVSLQSKFKLPLQILI